MADRIASEDRGLRIEDGRASMRVVCAWCDKVLHDPPGAVKTSHGVCKPLCPPAAAAFVRKQRVELAIT
jgi:hypothetical protein